MAEAERWSERMETVLRDKGPWLPRPSCSSTGYCLEAVTPVITKAEEHQLPRSA